MMSTGHPVAKAFDRILNGMAALAGVLVIFLMVGLTAEIINVQITGRSLPWMAELANYSLLWLTFLSAAWILRHEGHVRMDMVLAKLSDRNRRILDGVTGVAGAIICLIIAYISAKVTYQDLQTDRVIPIYLQVPAGAVNIIIAIGYVVLFLQFCRNVYNDLRGIGAEVVSGDRSDDVG